MRLFRVSGGPIKEILQTWTRCLERERLGHLTPHDCRRSTARNLTRSGISQHVAMAWTGHLTASMFERYDITSSEDLKLAAEKLATYVEAQQQKPTKVVSIGTSTNLARGVRKAGYVPINSRVFRCCLLKSQLKWPVCSGKSIPHERVE